MRKALVISLLSLLCVTPSKGQESQTQYNFLRLPASAHAAALGGDNVTLVEDDASLLFHNPALLSSVEDKHLHLGYMHYMQGVNAGTAAFNRVVKERATWAVAAQYVDYGKMRQTDENNQDLGTFSARDVALSGTLAYLLTDKLSGGITTRMIMSYLGAYSSVACGVDLGLNYYDPDREWSLSVVVKNLGGELKPYAEDYGRMPTDVQVGVSKRFQSFPLRVSLTAVDLTHGGYPAYQHCVAGIELLLTDRFWLGGGYNWRRAKEMRISTADGMTQGGAGLSLGAGLYLNRLSLNVAYGRYHVSSSSVLLNVGYAL